MSPPKLPIAASSPLPNCVLKSLLALQCKTSKDCRQSAAARLIKKAYVLGLLLFHVVRSFAAWSGQYIVGFYGHIQGAVLSISFVFLTLISLQPKSQDHYRSCVTIQYNSGQLLRMIYLPNFTDGLNCPEYSDISQ
jgi:hypothetical protein